MKILKIAPQPFFTPRGTPLSVYYRTLVTAEMGIEVDLLTYGEGEDVEIPGVRIIRIPRFKFLGSVKTGPSVLKLFLDVFIFFWTVGLLLKHRYKVVHAHEEAAFICLLLKPLFKFKWIYDMHSSLPEQLINFNFTKSKLLIKLFSVLENACLRSAEATIVICPSLYNYARKIIGNKNLVLIENSIFDPIKMKGNTSLESPLSFTDKPIVVYAGTLEHYQGIDLVIKAFSLILQQQPNLFLLIVGGTPQQIKTHAILAEKLGISSQCAFTGRVSPDLARKYVSQASVQISSRVSGQNTPLKVYQQLANGIPIVATNIYSHTQVLDEDVAFLVNPRPESIASGILAAFDLNGEAKLKVVRAKELYEQKYCRRIYQKKLRRVFEKLNLLEEVLLMPPKSSLNQDRAEIPLS